MPRGGRSDRAVVVTVTVKFAGLVSVKVTDGGETLHVAPCGAPVQASEIDPVKPFCGARARAKVADWPAETLWLEGAEVRMKSRNLTERLVNRCSSAASPCTWKESPPPVTAFKLLSVSVLGWPAVTVAGLNVQVAGF